MKMRRSRRFRIRSFFRTRTRTMSSHDYSSVLPRLHETGEALKLTQVIFYDTSCGRKLGREASPSMLSGWHALGHPLKSTFQPPPPLHSNTPMISISITQKRFRRAKTCLFTLSPCIIGQDIQRPQGILRIYMVVWTILCLHPWCSRRSRTIFIGRISKSG
ncbi:hypothetical protein BU23DRAFT_314250 [Bimuria novae-zelandiae CBS 107.79]|uniref:Uncharacterized protein n=1 Tax=Bimuria novae-zelandiae CBS 107.79 TaxID=1447943 RepID=A0A6A5UNW2_9PLEO|nr:hypothetical protein BU23DRAFT_314250 [Bimuria novae-zelandiae CBS 107.79]